MKIVSWNCHYGFTEEKKKQIFEIYAEADIFVIQECYEKDVKNPEYYTDWYGDSVDSELGIGIFCKNKKLKITRTKYFDNMKNCRYVLPYTVSSEQNDETFFVLCAVWTKQINENKEKYANYHVPISDALKESATEIKKEKDIIFIGDFNTGSVKNKQSESWFNKLQELMKNNQFSNSAGSKQLEPTFFNSKGFYLDDHCYLKTSGNIQKVSFDIGCKDTWINQRLSDHCPIILEIEKKQ